MNFKITRKIIAAAIVAATLLPISGCGDTKNVFYIIGDGSPIDTSNNSDNSVTDDHSDSSTDNYPQEEEDPENVDSPLTGEL